MSGEKTLAVVTITRPGLVVAAKIARESGAVLYVSERYLPNIPEDLRAESRPFDGVLKNLLPELFARYDGIIFIMALGIVVRSIGPLIADKTRDPAVLVGDVQGKFIISVLSGHLGGANRLAEEIARATGAMAVVTTGTDVTKNVAPDLISQEIGAELDPLDQLKRVSSAIVDGDPVLFLNLEGLPVPSLMGTLKPNILKADSFPDPFPQVRAAIVISSRLSTPPLPPGVEGISLVPRAVGVGIGCNRGTSSDEIAEALTALLAAHRLHPKSLQCFGSIDLKSGEQGILDTASRFSRPIFFFSRDQLGAVSVPNPSGVVLKYVGTPSVAEPAALLALIQSPPPWRGHPVLEVEKQKSGNVTLALARWVPDTPTPNP
ncbi:MAG: cobalamin biosynthesis protein [Nitrospirae bacterium]|nr:cobalamin biosynthesis protein [Nitrospirota bacterium]MCL5285275.1 cobalamin biosynthesis protein [Nitrospirota bacterium]